MSKRTGMASARNGKHVEREEAIQELDLLLEEIETLLIEQLIAVSLLRRSGQPCDLATILKIPIRLLRDKKNRTIKEEALLAYAEKRLKELNGL